MATATRSDELTMPDIEAARALLVEDDGEPLGTPWHRSQIGLFIESLAWHWRRRTDFFVGGNIFIYYSIQTAGDWTRATIAPFLPTNEAGSGARNAAFSSASGRGAISKSAIPGCASSRLRGNWF